MAKTFLEEFTDACRKLDGNNYHVKAETDRVHREAIRDKAHAFSQVEIPKHNPFKQGTGLTI